MSKLFKKKKRERIITEQVKKDMERISKISEEERTQVVFEKLLNSSKYNASALDLKKVKKMATNLATEEPLKENYLNKDFKAVKDYFQILESKEKHNLFESSSVQSKSDSLPTSYEITEEEDDTIEYPENLEQLKTNEKMKIKLVITEIHQAQNERTLRKICSPFASILNLSPEFGMFHSALSIGPWYLEWTNKSLCVPKKCFSNAALVALDVDHTLELVDVDYVIQTVSEVITRWNSLYMYNNKTYNCQLFVDEILAALGVDAKEEYKGQLGEYLKKLRNKGECKIEYELSPSLQEKCEIKEKKIEFKTHRELDNFMKKIEQHIPQFEFDFPHDYRLLKSFDRAFWLRHYRSGKVQEYFPLYKESDVEEEKICACPFKDPVATNSLGGDEWFAIDDHVQENWKKNIKGN